MMPSEAENYIDKVFSIESQNLPLKKKLEEYLNLLVELVRAKAGALFLVEELSQQLKLSCSVGLSNNEIKAINKAFAENGYKSLLHMTAKTKKPTVIKDALKQKHRTIKSNSKQTDIKSIISRPLIANGNLLGILQIGKATAWNSYKKNEKIINSIIKAIVQSIYRDELEKELKKTKNYLTNLICSSPSNVATTDQHGIITNISSSTEELFGYSHSELLGKPVKDLFVDGEAQANAIMELLTEKGIIKNLEVQVNKSDGSTVNIRLSTALLKDEKGKIIGTIGIFDDISEQKKLIKRLRGQAKYLANIMADSVDAIIIIDNKNIIKSWNKGAEQNFGYTSQEMVGHSFDKIVPKELMDVHELEKIKQEVYEKGFIRNYETYRIRKDGRKIFVDITRTAIKDEKGNIVGSSAIVRDITKVKELQRKLIHSEKLATIGRLSATLAHEIKNPLAGISGAVQLIGETLPSGDNRQDIIKEILRQTKRLDNTINDLLIYSKPQPLNQVFYNIHSLLDKVLMVLREELKTAKVKTENYYDKEFTKAYIDPQQMEQVFMNLIINAIQAMPKGGELKITTSQQKNKQLISFADSGIGIAAEMVRDIFRPFFTTKHRGAGLGLNISYNIVKSHSGTLKIKSELGKGSVFTIVLPRIKNNG